MLTAFVTIVSINCVSEVTFMLVVSMSQHFLLVTYNYDYNYYIDVHVKVCKYEDFQLSSLIVLQEKRDW